MTMHLPATRADLVAPFLASFVSLFVALLVARVRWFCGGLLDIGTLV